MRGQPYNATVLFPYPNIMKLAQSTITVATLALLLAGCGPKAESPSVELLLGNPLFAERYSEEMVDVLTELEIMADPILEDEGKKTQVANVKTDWLEIARNARSLQRKGLEASLITIGAFTQGDVLLLENGLYFGPTTEIAPGPSLHVYISTEIDPRDVVFPDPSAKDLGVLPLPYGASAMSLPDDTGDLIKYRTVVLWDTILNRIYGFAQLSPNN